MLETSNRFGCVSVVEIDLRKHGGGSRSRTLQTFAVEDLHRLRKERARLVGSPAAPGHESGSVFEVGTDERFVRELGCLLVVALRLARGTQRAGAIAGLREHLARLELDLGGVRSVRRF